jgi:hypothetical protein
MKVVARLSCPAPDAPPTIDGLTPPVLLTADAAVYAGVRLATLRVWRHRYGRTRRGTVEGNHHDFPEPAAIMARRAGAIP